MMKLKKKNNSSEQPFKLDPQLLRYVLAAMLTSASGQLGSTFDAIAVAQFVDNDAVSVFSLVMPIIVGINCLGLLMGFGANAICANATGRKDDRTLSAVFTIAIFSILTFGILASILLRIFTPQIVSALTDDSELTQMGTEYLQVYVLGTWIEMLAYACCLFTATDGHPMHATMAVVAGVLVNIVVDVVTMGYMDIGIAGCAIGSLLQFSITALTLCYFFHHHHSKFRLHWPGKRLLLPLFSRNLKEGAPISLGTLLMALSVLFINVFTFNALGNNGLFYWSVCLQMLLVGFIFINALSEAFFVLGEEMMAQGDMVALQRLFRKGTKWLCVEILGLMVLMCLPNTMAIVFGLEEEPMLSELTGVLRIFSLMLLPYSLSLVFAFTYQIRGHINHCTVVIAGHSVVLVIASWIFSTFLPTYYWWAFPAASILFLSAQLYLNRNLKTVTPPSQTTDAESVSSQ